MVTRCLQQLLTSGSHYVCSENYYPSPLVIKIKIVIICIAYFDIFCTAHKLNLCVFLILVINEDYRYHTYQYVNICLRNHLLNIRMNFITCDLVLKSPLFSLIPSVTIVCNRKKLKLKIDSAASIGGQGTFMEYVSFFWQLVVAAQSVSKQTTLTETINTM